MVDTAVRKGLYHAQIGVGQFHILAHQGHAYAVGAGKLTLHHVAPLAQIAAPLRQAEHLDHLLVQALAVQHERDLIEAAGVEVLEYAVYRQVAEHGDLGAHIVGQLMVGAAHQNIRRNADGAELAHAVLRRLGFQLACRVEVWHQRHMKIEAVFFACLGAHLAHGFQKRQTFDIAHGSPDFGDDHIRWILGARHGKDISLDFIGDMRNHLNGGAQVFAPALPVDHGFVYASAGHVAGLGEIFIDKAFIMSQVQIGFRAVVGHKHLAMLVGVHGAGIDVDIRIKLLNAHAQSPALQQPPQGRRRDALAQRGDNAAGYKDKLGIHDTPAFPHIRSVSITCGRDYGFDTWDRR